MCCWMRTAVPAFLPMLSRGDFKRQSGLTGAIMRSPMPWLPRNQMSTTSARMSPTQLRPFFGRTVLKRSSPNGGAGTYSYTGGLLTSKVDANQGVWNYSYDANGRLTSQTDPKGNATTLTYDGLDHVISTADPLGDTASSVYNSRGWKLAQTD